MWPPSSSRTTPQSRRYLVGLTPMLVYGLPVTHIITYEKGQTNCLMGVISLDLLRHTYISRQLLKSRELGSHRHFPSLSSSLSSQGVRTMSCGSLPPGDAPPRHTQLNFFRKNTAQCFTLGTWTSAKKASIMMTIIRWYTCVSKVSIP